jgi:type IV fimbrial biogenesis protein FimT
VDEKSNSARAVSGLGGTVLCALVLQGRSQASDLMVNLAIARAEAAKRGVRVSMCPTTTYASTPPTCQTGTLTTTWNQGYIVFADVNQDGAFNNGTDVLIAVAEATPEAPAEADAPASDEAPETPAEPAE